MHRKPHSDKSNNFIFVIDNANTKQRSQQSLEVTVNDITTMRGEITRDAKKGDRLRGVKSVTPVTVRSLIKTYEEATKGVTTVAGGEIVPANEFSDIELAAQTFGFSPLRIGMAYDARSAIKGTQPEIRHERNFLLQRYFNTVMGKGNTSDILDDNQEFNHVNPGNGISEESILKSVRAKQRARVKKQSGVGLERKDEHLPKLGRFGGYSVKAHQRVSFLY